MDTRNGRAVVNVKIYKSTLTPEEWTSIRVESGIFDSRFPLAGEDFGPDWIEAYDRVTIGNGYWQRVATSNGIGQATELARELFAPVLGPDRAGKLECFQEGRSGGWLVIEGLPPVEDWGDSECVGCGIQSNIVDTCTCGSNAGWTPLYPGIREAWTEFERRTKEIAQDTLYRFAELLALNVYLPEREAKKDAGREQEQRIADADFLLSIADDEYKIGTRYLGQGQRLVEIANRIRGN